MCWGPDPHPPNPVPFAVLLSHSACPPPPAHASPLLCRTHSLVAALKAKHGTK